MTTNELRSYSERVFRRHNRVTTRIMLAPPAAGDVTEAERRRIERAESRMNRACTHLNQVAEARAGGKDASAALQNKVRKTVRSCAETTRRLETLLDKHGIGMQAPEARSDVSDSMHA